MRCLSSILTSNRIKCVFGRKVSLQCITLANINVLRPRLSYVVLRIVYDEFIREHVTCMYLSYMCVALVVGCLVMYHAQLKLTFVYRSLARCHFVDKTVELYIVLPLTPPCVKLNGR